MSQNIAVGDIIVSQTVCQAPGQISVSNRYWKCNLLTGVGTVTFKDFATFLAGAQVVDWTSVMWNSASFYGVQVRRAFPLNDDRWQSDVSFATPGTGGALPLPTQSCGLLAFRGDTLGKHGSGRLYFPFPASAMNTNTDAPSVLYQGVLGSQGILMSTTQAVPGSVGTGIAQMTPVLFDRLTHTANTINAYFVRPAWATQRRRGAFGRLNSLPF